VFDIPIATPRLDVLNVNCGEVDKRPAFVNVAENVRCVPDFPTSLAGARFIVPSFFLVPLCSL